MTDREVIVRVGAEGGSLTLFGTRASSNWRFQLRVFDNTPDLIDEPMNDRTTEWVDSWSQGLALLDRYRWFRLRPVRVHPEFREAVLAPVAVSFLNIRPD